MLGLSAISSAPLSALAESNVALTGTYSATSSFTATIRGEGDLSGTSNAVSSFTAALKGEADLSGTSNAVSSFVGNGYVAADMSGTYSATSSFALAAADLGVTATGSSSAVSSFVATIRGEGDLSGTSNAVSSFTGAMKGEADLSASNAPLIFRALDGDSGIANLPLNLTLNGIEVVPSVRYEGKDATSTTWPGVVGPTLAIADNGLQVTPPTLDTLTPATASADRGVKFNAGKYYEKTSDTTLDIGTDKDLVVELIVRTSGDNSRFISVGSAGSGNSWAIDDANSNALLGATSGGVGFAAYIGTINDHWGILHAFYDRSENSTNGVKVYLNGILRGSYNGSAIGDVSPGRFNIGGLSNARNNSTIAMITVWKRAAWLPGGASNGTMSDAIARERAALYFGTNASTAVGQKYPITSSRTTTAKLDRVIDEGTGERRLFSVDSNWMRLGKRKELAGGEYTRGFISEAQRTNLILQSQTFDNASWTKNNAATVSANAIAAPDNDTTADGVIVSTYGGSVSQEPTLTAASYTFSVWLKKGNKDWVGLRNSVLNNAVAFNLNTGVVGLRYAATNNITGTIESYGNGWYRCAVTFTGTAATTQMRIDPLTSNFAENGSDAFYTGDGVTVAAYLWGAQIELAPEASSYIATTTATAARTRDDLVYTPVGNFNAPTGRVKFNAMVPVNSTATGISFIGVQDSANNNYLTLQGSTSTPGRSRSQYGSAGALQADINGSSGSIADGEIHSHEVRFATNDIDLLFDGAEVGTDTNAVMIASTITMARLGIGNNGASSPAGQGAFISNVQIFGGVPAATFTATLRGEADLSASRTATSSFNLTGSLGINGSGSSNAVSSFVGTVRGEGDLSGTLSGVGSFVAALKGEADLSALFNGTSSLNGSMDGETRSTASYSGISSFLARLIGEADLSGSSNSVSSFNITLTFGGGTGLQQVPRRVLFLNEDGIVEEQNLTDKLTAGQIDLSQVSGSAVVMSGGSSSTNQISSALASRFSMLFSSATAVLVPATHEWIGVTTTEAVVNNAGNDLNFRIAGDNDPNLGFFDAGTDRLGLGNAAPQQKLDVTGAARLSTFLELAEIAAPAAPAVGFSRLYGKTDSLPYWNSGTEVALLTSAHEAASDPHPGYQRESEKGQASGYASLDGSILVPVAQLPTATTVARGVSELATSAETTAGLVVQASDTRLSDSRTPTAHAASHASGGSDPLATASIASAMVQDNAITLAKMQQIAGPLLLGNSRNVVGNVEVIGVSDGLGWTGVGPGANIQIANDGVITKMIADATSNITGVTVAKIQHIATTTVLGRSTAATGAVEVLLVQEGLTVAGGILGIPTNGIDAVKIAARAVTFSKTPAIASTRILGRVTASPGDIEELTASQVSSNFGFYVAGSAPSFTSATISSADITFSANQKGPVIKTSTGVAYRIQVTTGGVLEAVAI